MKNYTCPLAFLCLLLSTQPLKSLNPGDIMFVGFDADSPDGFAVTTLVDIPNGTVITFFDHDGVGQIDWTANTLVPAGTVVIFQSVQNSSASVNLGNINRTANFQINGENEVLVAKEGSTCLAAIRNDTSTPISAGCGALSPAYIVSSNLLDEDVMVYTGSTVCNSTLSDCQSMIANNNNWATEDGSGDQSTNGSFPDFPADLPTSFSGSALPLTLTQFYGKSSENKIFIHWSTVFEENCSHFSIEKLDDENNFFTLGNIFCNSNSAKEQQYQMTDHFPIFGRNYYRLKQVDLDGSITFSKTIAVTHHGHKTIRISPNPSNGTLDLEFSDESGLGRKVQVFNTMGRVVKECEIAPFTVKKTLDLSNLQPGNYFIRIYHGNSIETTRIIIV